MINNSTNINKTSTHLSPQTFEQKKTMIYGVRNVGPSLGCDGIKPVNEILTVIFW